MRVDDQKCGSVFDILISMIKYNNDILMVSEMKLDSSFTNAQFVMERYARPFTYDRKCHGAGIILFTREDIPAKILSAISTNDFEGFFVELNFCKK